MPDFESTSTRRTAAPADPKSFPAVNDHELRTFVQESSQSLATEYHRIRRRAADDPGTAGDEGEGNWARLLSEWLPSQFHVRTKGRILTSDARLSQQIDVVVLRPSYPRVLLDRKVYLAGGVIAAFECKLTLKKRHVEEAASRSVRLSELVGRLPGAPQTELRGPILFGLLAHSTSFTTHRLECIDELLEATLGNCSHPAQALDVVCVADLATWKSVAKVFTQAGSSIDQDTWIDICRAQEISLEGGVRQHYSRVDGAPPELGLYDFLEHLTQRLAWEHPDQRQLADYWVDAHTGGPSLSVAARSWGFNVFSDSVQDGIRRGQVSSARWDPWSG